MRYGRHPLDIEEVRQHIQAGKLPTKLVLTWNGCVSFILTESLALRKITTDVPPDCDAESGFDADVAIITSELSQLVPELIEALGGEA